MAVELITGHKGAVHVDAADDAALYAAIAGKGEYVLQLGSQLACTMTTANKAHIASGHGLMQGRHWLVDAEGADVTIENGTQGQKRNDLIVARYERDAANGNVESVALRAIKGAPTTGAAADPSYVHGDVLGSGALVNEQPLYRIPLDGITVGTPVKLFETLTPQKEAWDSVSQLADEISWTQLSSGVRYCVRAGLCIIDIDGLSLTAGEWRDCGKLPVKPASELLAPLVRSEPTGPTPGNIGQVTVNSGGVVWAVTRNSTGAVWAGSLVFPVA